jgi:hypothetical protein
MTEEMKAGRELDARVAECVMGKQAASWGGFGLMEDAERIAVDLPHYSTDIAAAWLVMDEMDRRASRARPAVFRRLHAAWDERMERSA